MAEKLYLVSAKTAGFTGVAAAREQWAFQKRHPSDWVKFRLEGILASACAKGGLHWIETERGEIVASLAHYRADTDAGPISEIGTMRVADRLMGCNLGQTLLQNSIAHQTMAYGGTGEPLSDVVAVVSTNNQASRRTFEAAKFVLRRVAGPELTTYANALGWGWAGNGGVNIFQMTLESVLQSLKFVNSARGSHKLMRKTGEHIADLTVKFGYLADDNMENGLNDAIALIENAIVERDRKEKRAVKR